MSAEMPRGEQAQAKFPLIRLAIYWTVVGIPLIWGVSQTLEKAMTLFQ